MKITALLPMKANSERVPNKNLKIFDKYPLYHYIVRTLKKVKYIDKIVVNTDSDKIKDDLKNNFPEIIIYDRPKSLVGDYVSMNKIIEYDISKIESKFFLQTHSTNPLLKYETINSAIELMMEFYKNNNHDSIFSVTKILKRFYDIKGKPFNHDPRMLVTQNLEPLFEENSCFYIFSKDSFRKKNSRIGLSPFMYETTQLESTDIDYPEDFKLAQILYKQQ